MNSQSRNFRKIQHKNLQNTLYIRRGGVGRLIAQPDIVETECDARLKYRVQFNRRQRRCGTCDLSSSLEIGTLT